MRNKLMMLIVGGALAVASSAWSLTLNGVGGYDNYLTGFQKVKGGESSPTAELEKVRDYLNDTTVTFTARYDQESTNFNWSKLADSSGYAMALPYRPEYFLVKIGAKDGAIESLLFENVATPLDSLDWAVIKFDTESYTIKGIDAISHLSEFNGAPVPEPGTMMLLGAGFLGLAVYGKRRKNV